MTLLEIMFIFTTILYTTIHASNKNICPTTNCGTLSLNYPFKLQNTQPQDNCTYIDLQCNTPLVTDATATVSFPYGGEFNVRYISYYVPFIQLDDPGNCLMRRLMNNLNLSSSGLQAVTYENYMFYVCPSDADIIKYSYFYPILCLSNSINATVATSLVSSSDMLESGCELIGSWMLPVLRPGQFEFDGSNGDLYLTWSTSSCSVCKDAAFQQDNSGESKKISWAIIAASPFFVPAFVTVAISLTICLLRLVKCIFGRNDSSFDMHVAYDLPVSSTATATLSVEPVRGGLDESKIDSCTELVVISEIKKIPGPDSDSHTCSICLDNYSPEEVVRSIAKCRHCFHAHCIGIWLRKNGTCPVCRMILYC